MVTALAALGNLLLWAVSAVMAAKFGTWNWSDPESWIMPGVSAVSLLSAWGGWVFWRRANYRLAWLSASPLAGVVLFAANVAGFW